jgi:hypothetical protein
MVGDAEPGAAPDRAAILVSRGTTPFQAAQQVSLCVGLDDRLLTASRRDEYWHSDRRVIILFGDGGCRWDLMNEKSARCIQWYRPTKRSQF